MSAITILIDARYCKEHSTGVGNYARNMLRALDESLADHNDDARLYALFQGKNDGTDTPPLELENIEPVFTRVSYSVHPHHEIWLNAGLPKMFSRLGVDVFHNLAYAIPWRKKIRTRRIVSVHDLIAYEVPENYSALFSRYMKFITRRAVKRADMIVAFSQYVKEQIMGRFKIRDERITIIPHGVSEIFKPFDNEQKERWRRDLDVPEQFIFSVGSSEPRKNIITLLKAMRQLKQHDQSLPHTLIIAVSDKISRRSPLHQMVKSLDIEGDVRFVHVTSPREMCAFYNTAEIFVFQTRSEGFGFPVLEAMACGTPVICSNIPPLKETAGECAEMFSPVDYVTLAKKMYNVLIDEEKQQEMGEAGISGAGEFTWSHAAAQYLSLYTSVPVKS